MVTKYNNVIYLLPLESFPAQYLANLRNYIKAFYFPMKVKILKLKEVERMDIETTVNEDKGKLQYHGKQIISKLEQKFYKLKNVFALICLLRTDMAPDFQFKYSYGYAKSNPKISIYSI